MGVSAYKPRPLLIGLALGRQGTGEPLSGRVGRRLASLCGLSLDAYLAAFERCNVSDTPDIVDRIAARRAVVVLGREAARVVGLRGYSWLDWMDAFRDGGTVIAVCPHPSGRNRWWNDSANYLAAGRFWRTLAQDSLTISIP